MHFLVEIVGDELLKDIIDDTNSRKIPYLLCEMGFDQKKTFRRVF
jgi:release factor glutamine methyltransferase